MPQVEFFKWYIRDHSRRSGERLTGWKMTAADAQKIGALRPEPATREMRDVPEAGPAPLGQTSPPRGRQ